MELLEDISLILLPIAPVLGTALAGPLGGIFATIIMAALAAESGDKNSMIEAINKPEIIENIKKLASEIENNQSKI